MINGLVASWPIVGLMAMWLALTSLKAAELPWLRGAGTRLVDARGSNVVLRGVNLGGWLVEEMWMMPFQTKPPQGSAFQPIKDHVTLWRTIESRVGAADATRVRTALREAWLSETDFERIRAAGMNCVRLPFLYDLLGEPDGWSWLDRAVDWAGQRGIYVILDLHGAPGRQSKDHHTGEADVNRLFKDPAMVRQTEEVWMKVARRYRDRSTVAGYDLLNEPMGATNNATLYDVQDRLYRAIRSVDSRHLIFIEDGYKGIDRMPDPASRRWQNIVLSVHSYKFDAKAEEDHIKHLQSLVSKVTRKQQESAAPFFLGEFNLEPHGKPGTLRTVIQTLEQHGWSWSLWTYKTAMRNGSGTNSMWGWYRSPKKLETLNPFQDSTAELLRKVEQLRTERMEEHVAMTQAFRGN